MGPDRRGGEAAFRRNPGAAMAIEATARRERRLFRAQTETHDSVAGLPIDHVHLSRYTLGDRALEIEILGLFAGQAPETLAALAGAVDAEAWRNAAHTLKGSARGVGALRVAATAAAAEALAGAPESERARAADLVGDAVREVCRYIDGLSPDVAA